MTDPNGTLRRIDDNVNGLLQRVAKIETIMNTLPGLEADVRALRDAETRRQGAVGAFSWIAKNGPSLVAATIAFIAGLFAQKGIH